MASTPGCPPSSELRATATTTAPSPRSHSPSCSARARSAKRSSVVHSIRSLWARTRLGGAAGQGTVEYVALILLVAGLVAAVVLAAGGVKGKGIADAVTEKIRTTIEGVASKKG